MLTSLDTRKPVDQMTLEDLKMFPVWEFCLGEDGGPGRDETWVRPVATKVVPAGSWSQLVAAEFSSRAWVESLFGFIIFTTAKSDHLERILRNRPEWKEVPDPDMAGSGYSTSGGSIISITGSYHFIPKYPNIERFRSQRERWVKRERVNFAAALGYDLGEIFPIRYRLLVPIEDELSCRDGSIN